MPQLREGLPTLDGPHTLPACEVDKQSISGGVDERIRCSVYPLRTGFGEGSILAILSFFIINSLRIVHVPFGFDPRPAHHAFFDEGRIFPPDRAQRADDSVWKGVSTTCSKGRGSRTFAFMICVTRLRPGS